MDSLMPGLMRTYKRAGFDRVPLFLNMQLFISFKMLIIMKNVFLMLMCLALPGLQVNARTDTLNAEYHYTALKEDHTVKLDDLTRLTNEKRQSLWAAETSLTFHMVRIYMLKFSYKYSGKVELGFGPAFQNWKNEDQSFLGQAHAYTLVLSSRYYFWNKFHVEVELWPAWNRFESFIDNNTYKGLELWAEYKLGYRVDMGQRFYMNIQPGIGHPVWMQNKWPGVEQHDTFFDLIRNETIFVPQVLLGFRF